MSLPKRLWRLEVEWRDSKLDNGGWETVKSHLKDRRGVPCYSVGFVLADDKTGIVLASSVYGDNASGVTHIPAGIIIKKRRPAVSGKSWGVYEIPAGIAAPRCRPARVDEIHVAPCNDDGILLCTHRLTIGCDCRPTLVRGGGPLDTPIISHREPGHPGAEGGYDA